MARLSKQTAKSRQKGILRYIASSDIDRTARDLNVSTKQLTRFIRADPATLQKDPERYRKLLDADTKKVARSNDVTLVQRLSGKRLQRAYDRAAESDRLTRSIRYSTATRERYRKIENGKTVYYPVKQTRVKASREQILSNLSGMNRKRIMSLHQSGDITDGEAKQLMRQLYKNSGVKPSVADKAFEDLKG